MADDIPMRNAIGRRPALVTALRTFDNIPVFEPHLRPFGRTRLPIPVLDRPIPLPFMPWWGTPGIPREQVTRPIAAAAPPSDMMSYAMPADEQTRCWLPRWRLRRSQSRYDIDVRAEDDGRWAIAFGLEPFAADEVAALAAGGAAPIAAALSAAIRYLYDGTTVERALPADELVPDARGQVATFRLALEDRDALLRAFRSNAAGTTLTIMRRIEAAVERPYDLRRDGRGVDRFRFAIDRGVLARELQRVRPQMIDGPDIMAAVARRQIDPNLLATRRVALHRTVGTPFLGRYRGLITIPPYDDGPVETPPPYEPPAQPDPVPDPDPVQPDEPVIVDIPPPPDPPESILPIAPPPAPTVVYDEDPFDLPCAIPLRFDEAEHPYLFAGGRGAAGVGATLERVLVADAKSGRTHAYFRDAARGDLFFYLPDGFKLARHQDAPFTPSLLFRVQQGDDPHDVQVGMSAELRPTLSQSRLDAAIPALRQHAGTAGGGAPPVLQPLLARGRLRLTVPRGNVPTPVDNPADVDLANRFLIVDQFGFADFQEVFAALSAADAAMPLLRGIVLVETGLAAAEQLPVQMRFDDMSGDLFTSVEATTPDDAVSCVIRNATESPVTVSALAAMLERDGTRVAAQLEGLPAFPFDLAPDAELTLTAKPLRPLPGEGAVDAIFDTSGAVSRPDMERILERVMDRSVAQQSEREVILLTTDALLAGAGGDPVQMVVVEFAGNVTARVTSDAPQTTAEVPVPLADMLLRRDGQGRYRYRQTVVHVSGRQSADADWRTSDAGILVVPQQG